MSVAQARDYGQKNPFGTPTDRDYLDEVESRVLSNGKTFWNATPQLQLVAYASSIEELSPWATLIAVQGNVLSHVSPRVVLVKRSGNKGTVLGEGTSLNMFGALGAITGGGKSVTFREANSLFPPKSNSISDGTGQGIVKRFVKSHTVTEDSQGVKLQEPFEATLYKTHTVVIHAPEVTTLNGELARDGSKTSGMMCSMWVGEPAGMNNSEKDRNGQLYPNTYRLVGVWGVQPKNAVSIIERADDGFPQRFICAPSDEYRINGREPKRTPPPPGTEIRVPSWSPPGMNNIGMGDELPDIVTDDTQFPAPIWVEWSPQMHIDIPRMRQELKDAKGDRDPYAPMTDEERERIEAAVMRSHFILTRIKQAVYFAFMHGRCNPTDLDWELAGLQMEISEHEWAGLWIAAQESARLERVKKGRERGEESHAANAERDRLVMSDVDRAAAKMWNKLADKPRTLREITMNTAKSQRKFVNDALTQLQDEGRVQRANDGRYWAFYKGSAITPEFETSVFSAWGGTS